MRAIILAAGAGRRLAGLGWDRPKCLLPCPQETLLDNALTQLSRRSVREVSLVVGFERKLVLDAATKHGPVQAIVNEHFESTNTIHSLYLARDQLADEVLIINGDLWFQPEVLDAVLEGEGSRLAVEPKPCGAEEVKVLLDAEGRVLRIGKALLPEGCAGESVGLVRLTGQACPKLADALVRFDDSLGRTDLFYESALDSILNDHVVTAVTLAPFHAIEIDTPKDLRRAEQIWRIGS